MQDNTFQNCSWDIYHQRSAEFLLFDRKYKYIYLKICKQNQANQFFSLINLLLIMTDVTFSDLLFMSTGPSPKLSLILMSIFFPTNVSSCGCNLQIPQDTGALRLNKKHTHT